MSTATKKYKLLSGKHAEMGEFAEGKPARPTKMYNPGDVIESTDDLCAAGNPAGFPPKFELVHEAQMPATYWNPNEESLEAFAARMKSFNVASTPGTMPPPGATAPVPFPQENSATAQAARAGFNTIHADRLQGLSIEQLRAFAAEQDIELPPGADKAAAIRFILGILEE